MAGRGAQSFKKRQKEQQRKEKQGSDAHADIGGWWHGLQVTMLYACGFSDNAGIKRRAPAVPARSGAPAV